MTKQKTKKISEVEKAAFSTIGRIGGTATMKKHGKKHMSEIGKKGAKKRWAKQK